MLHRLLLPGDLADHETRQIITPALLAIFILSLVLSAAALFTPVEPAQQGILFAFGTFGILYESSIVFFLNRFPKKIQALRWPLLLLHAVVSILAVSFIPLNIQLIPYTVITLATAITQVLWGRLSAYLYIALILFGHGLTSWLPPNQGSNIWIEHSAFFVLTVGIVEFTQRLANINMSRIQRLKMINEFARQFGSSIETQQVLEIVGATLQKAIQADTYFLGLKTENDNIYFHLLYDDGENFPPTEIAMEGTLSGWIMRNQRPLFIPDMSEDINLEGVKMVLTGNNRNNACWMGVPMRAGNINGVIAVGSYRADAFDRTALELLENLAQHAALALDNAHHHTQVEIQAQLDSLTGVYNHGHIVKLLRWEIEKVQAAGGNLSLIMLDIDFFKLYNDNYGHQVGDEVLIKLCQLIRSHIKSTDSIGRWGGEEFAIILPGANGSQAFQIAHRICETVQTLSIPIEKGALPFPTVSQGIAVCPFETTDMHKLIDLADQRLYTAKARGRNQIEPAPTHRTK